MGNMLLPQLLDTGASIPRLIGGICNAAMIEKTFKPKLGLHVVCEPNRFFSQRPALPRDRAEE